jgi:hypothetical protein
MPASVITWTRVTNPDVAVALLPPWFAGHMLSGHGRYGFLLTTGDVLRVTWVMAIHLSSAGAILLDVSLDSAGIPLGVDLAWQTKHFLGAPVPGANFATLNLSSVVLAVEFAAAEFAEKSADKAGMMPDELEPAADPVLEITAISRE